jgi:dolichol-phosphate mannosyltransferase
VISVVVPTFNERPNIETLVQRAGTALAFTGETFELIIVDDDSPDGTADAVRGLQATRPWLKLVVRENARDLSTAVIAGWRTALGNVLGCMDADLQHPPEVLPQLVERLRTSGVDIVVASRNVHGGGVGDWSLARRLVSWTATLLATFVLPGTLGEVRDPMTGFFLVRRPVLDGVVLNPIGYKILLEVLARGNYTRIEEVPFVFEERSQGGSKIGFSTMLKYLVHLVRISLETGEATRMIKFALVGLSGVVVNFFCYRLLVAVPGWTVWAAASGAAGLAVVNNFVWNEKFTFWETHKAAPDWNHVLQRFLAFALLSTAGLLLNVGLVSLLVGRLGVPWAPGLLAGIGLAGLWNFFANSNLTWHAWWDRKTLSKIADAGLARQPTQRGS